VLSVAYPYSQPDLSQLRYSCLASMPAPAQVSQASPASSNSSFTAAQGRKPTTHLCSGDFSPSVSHVSLVVPLPVCYPPPMERPRCHRLGAAKAAPLTNSSFGCEHIETQCVTASIASDFKSKNTDGRMLRRRHQVGRGEAESTPAETALPVDSLVESTKCVVETGSFGG